MSTSDEIFEVFDKQTWKKIGEKRRGDVHKDGDLHRSVNVLLFNAQGQLLMQKRASNKDVCPNMWDISCAEHLKPGESYLDGAKRGLFEELGISNIDLVLVRPEHEKLGKYPNVIDHELSQCFKCTFDGDFSIDLGELSQVAFFDISNLPKPQETTPWFQNDWKFYTESK